MSRTCSVCAHEDAVLVNEALVIGRAGNRRTAAQYGLSEQAIRRHREHIPRLLVKAAEAEEIAQAESLVARLSGMVRRVEAFVERAEEAEDGFEFRASVAEWRRQIELLAKIAGELQQEGTTNITLNPEWLEIRAVIIGALEGHPDARESFLKALDEVGSGSH